MENETGALFEEYVLGNYGRFPVSLARGAGTEVWSEEGTRYLDFASGIAVCSLGHGPPMLTEAIREQAGRLLHVSNLYHIREQGLLAQHLVERVVREPGKVFFCNSGAEGNEVLIKLARKAGRSRGSGGRSEIITFEGSFHGRTMAGISATAQSKVQAGFEPLLPGFVHLPFADLEALDRAVGERTAAVLLEPVQGEGGIRPFPAEFLRETARLCRERGALLLFDEVQCGLGRLGDVCGWRALLGDDRVKPDAVSWAKGLGGGLPVGAVWITDRDELSAVLGPGSHGCTFGGNPLVSVGALAVLREIEERGWDRWADEIGTRIIREIEGWRSPFIAEVRGRGLMLGIVLNSACEPHLRERGGEGPPSRWLVGELMKDGLLTVAAGPDVVRLLPPLNVGENEVEEALSILRGRLTEGGGH